MNSHLRIGSKIKQMIYLPSSQVINGQKSIYIMQLPMHGLKNEDHPILLQKLESQKFLLSTTFSKAKKSLKNEQTFFMDVLV